MCGWFKTSHSLRGRQKGREREREKEQSELNILDHEEQGLTGVLTRTNRQLWGKSEGWTGVIFNECLGINHIHDAFVYTFFFFFVDKLHSTAWVVGGRKMGYPGKKEERR